MTDEKDMTEQPGDLAGAIRLYALADAYENRAKEIKDALKAHVSLALDGVAETLGAAGANFSGIGKATMVPGTDKVTVTNEADAAAWAIFNGFEDRVRTTLDAERLEKHRQQGTLEPELETWLQSGGYIVERLTMDDEVKDAILVLPRKGAHPIDSDGEKMEWAYIAQSRRPYARITPDKAIKKQVAAHVTATLGEIER